jgi:hypothetical protein
VVAVAAADVEVEADYLMAEVVVVLHETEVEAGYSRVEGVGCRQMEAVEVRRHSYSVAAKGLVELHFGIHNRILVGSCRTGMEEQVLHQVDLPMEQLHRAVQQGACRTKIVVDSRNCCHCWQDEEHPKEQHRGH